MRDTGLRFAPFFVSVLKTEEIANMSPIQKNKKIIFLVTVFFLVNCSSYFQGESRPPNVTISPEPDNSMSGLFLGSPFLGDSIRTICVAPVKVDPSDNTSFYLSGYGNTNNCPQFSYTITDPTVVEAAIAANFVGSKYKVVDRANLESIFDERKLDMQGLTTTDLSQIRQIYNIDCFLLCTLHFSRYCRVVKYDASKRWRFQLIPETKISLKIISTKTAEVLWNHTEYIRGTFFMSKPIMNQNCAMDPQAMLSYAIEMCLWPFIAKEQRVFKFLHLEEKNARTNQDSAQMIKEYIAAYPNCVPLVADLSQTYLLHRDTSNFIKYARYGFSKDTTHNRGIIINYAHSFLFRNALDSAVYYYRDAMARYNLGAVKGIESDFAIMKKLYRHYNKSISYVSSKLF